MGALIPAACRWTVNNSGQRLYHWLFTTNPFIGLRRKKEHSVVKQDIEHPISKLHKWLSDCNVFRSFQFTGMASLQRTSGSRSVNNTQGGGSFESNVSQRFEKVRKNCLMLIWWKQSWRQGSRSETWPRNRFYDWRDFSEPMNGFLLHCLKVERQTLSERKRNQHRLQYRNNLLHLVWQYPFITCSYSIFQVTSLVTLVTSWHFYAI